MAQLRIARYKRHGFGSVFLPNPASGGPPIERSEACFDIVDNRLAATSIVATEILLVAVDAALALSPAFLKLRNRVVCMRLGDSVLAKSLLELCAVNISCASPSAIRELIRAFSVLDLNSQTLSEDRFSHALSCALNMSPAMDHSAFACLYQGLPLDPLRALNELENRVRKLDMGGTTVREIGGKKWKERYRNAMDAIARLRDT